MACRSNHGTNLLGILDNLHFTKFFAVRRYIFQKKLETFTAVLHPTAFPMVQIEPSDLIHCLGRQLTRTEPAGGSPGKQGSSE